MGSSDASVECAHVDLKESSERNERLATWSRQPYPPSASLRRAQVRGQCDAPGQLRGGRGLSDERRAPVTVRVDGRSVMVDAA